MPFLRLVSSMFLALMVASLAALGQAPDNSSYSQQKQAYGLPATAAKVASFRSLADRPGASSQLIAFTAKETTQTGKVPFMGQNVPGAGQ